MAANPGRFHLPAYVPDNAWQRFGRWYSTSGVERENNPIRQGRFLSELEWYERWSQVDEEDSEDED